MTHSTPQAKVSLVPDGEVIADPMMTCESNATFLARLPPESMKLVVTSPPYNIGKEYEARSPLDSYLADQAAVIAECVGNCVAKSTELVDSPCTADGRAHNASGKRIAETMSVTQLFRMFPDDKACYAWLEDARWNGDPVCPHCGGMENIVKAQPSKPHAWRHKDCRKTLTATVGTCMHATKTPLQNWIYTTYTVVTSRKGISAMQLSKELGVAYRTAWHMLHRIREACGRGDFKLGNEIEVNETHIGGKEGNKHANKKLGIGGGMTGNVAVVGIRERGGKLKAAPVETVNRRTMIPFIEDNVEPGATVYTDDATAYGGLPTVINQYQHEVIRHGAGEYVRDTVHTNGIEAVWAVLKRSTHGTWHHVSPKHLGRYVDEATFRLNRGNCEVDTLDRMRDFARGCNERLRWVDLIADNGESATPVAVR